MNFGTIHYRAMEHLAESIRSVSTLTGGYADLREVTFIEGDDLAQRGEDDIEIVVGLDRIDPGDDFQSVSKSAAEGSITVWVPFGARTRSAEASPSQVLDFIVGDIWKAVIASEEARTRGGLAENTKLTNVVMGGAAIVENASAWGAQISFMIEFEHSVFDPGVQQFEDTSEMVEATAANASLAEDDEFDSAMEGDPDA